VRGISADLGSRLQASARAEAPEAVVRVDLHGAGDIEEGGLSLSGTIRNEESFAIDLEAVGLKIDLADLKLGRARVLAGTGRMGTSVARFDVGSTPFEIVSEQFLLFRRAPDDFILAGLLTWRILQGELAFQNGVLEVRFAGDGKVLAPRAGIPLEKIFLARGAGWQDLLSLYAQALARENGAAPKAAAWRGWGTWDYYADHFGEKQILENLTALRALGAPCDLVQIDDGYSVWGGDWLSLKAGEFPLGMDGLVAKAEREGCRTGIWLAPFLAHQNSKLVREHPEWLLQTGRGRLTMAPYPYYVLDYSLDETCAMLAETLKVMKRQWGIHYFKLDFLLMGVKPCLSAVKGVTPLERFHRCFDAIAPAVGADSYLLGCSASFGPCIGRVDGLRTGPDIAPRFSQVRRAAFCNVSSYYFQGAVFNCDPDYLLLRSAQNEDAERTAEETKRGNLSLPEAQLWADFVSLFGHGIISSDKVSLLDGDRKEILRRALAAGPSEACLPLDLWSGDGTSIPGCILSRRGAEIRLALFNWNEEKTTRKIAGFTSGDRLVSERDGAAWTVTEGALAIEIDPHSSKLLLYQGEKSFARLGRDLVPEATETVIEFPSILGRDFHPPGRVVPIDLGPAAQCPLRLDRKTGLAMMRGLYAGVAVPDRLLGIPNPVAGGADARVIELRSAEPSRTVSIRVGRKLKALYFVHGCEHPTEGELNSYRFQFATHTEELTLIVGTHIGNTHAHYAQPWTSEKARFAWHDPLTEACLFMMEWTSPCPDEMLEHIEITGLRQRANFYLVGAAGCA
jgi:alpha-galactosidase